MTGTVPVLVDLGRGLREGFFMFWETLWPLVLGFGLSGAVQAFVSRESMQRRLGTHGVAATARASGYGMISSSCSYAASAMSKSLFVKGADFVSSMVFMFASTNLVLELGIILVVLMGWQFMASEFIGGAIMIVLLAVLAGLWLRGRAIDEARERLRDSSADLGHRHDAEPSHSLVDALTTSACATNAPDEPAATGLEGEPWSVKLRSTAGWANAATYTMADLTMLRREMLIGYGIAGFLAALVPVHWWNVVFLHGHGGWTSVENVVVGPFIAIISFVCSIGNVPLAAALWHGGISFGGVVSFIFADLIAFPLLLIYRRYYGTRLAAQMLATFWGVMALAGLATEGLFNLAHLTPSTRPAQPAPLHFSWDYTTYLNLVFLAVFAVLYWVYRHREALGGGAGYALDPVCGMQVQIAQAPARTVHEGTPVYFCSDHCRHRFDADPARFLDTKGHEMHSSHEGTTDTDPVCGMAVDRAHAAGSVTHAGVTYYFCGAGCAERFAADPPRYLEGGPIGMDAVMSSMSPTPKATSAATATDPVCGMSVDPATAIMRTIDGTRYFFCAEGCAETFESSHA